VVYRRVDDDFIDPLHFRPDSVIGCPGIVNAARAGQITLANAIGNGVADDKLIYTYVPDLIRYYLRAEPILDNIDTWRLEEPGALAEVLDRLDELVVKPVDGSGGKGIVIGPRASRSELDLLRERLIADPRGWIAQPLVQLSTVPTLIEDELAPRHVDLRPFAVNNGDNVWVLPGGLTRVALPEGELVVNSSQGGGSKDTWVLSAPIRPEPAPGSDGLAAVNEQLTAPDVAGEYPTASDVAPDTPAAPDVGPDTPAAPDVADQTPPPLRPMPVPLAPLRPLSFRPQSLRPLVGPGSRRDQQEQQQQSAGQPPC
jgi:hypothetical protein